MSDKPKDLTPAYVALGLGVVCIACSAIFVKVAALPGSSSAFYRMLIASAVAIPWCLVKRPSRPSRNAVLLTLAGGMFLAITLALWQVALLITSATNATLLGNVTPMWVALGALMLFRERLGSYLWLGLVLALAGMVLVVSGGGRRFVSFNHGDMLAVGASFFYAVYFLVTQRVRAGMDTLTFLALSAASGVVLLLAVCVVSGAPLSGFSARAWNPSASCTLIISL